MQTYRKGGKKKEEKGTGKEKQEHRDEAEEVEECIND